MTVPAIFELLDREIFTRAAPTHNVFVWGIDKFLHAGDGAMLERGYRLHCRFIWDKRNGPAPAFTIRYAHEYLSWFYRPRLLKVDPRQRGKFSTVIREEPREHSRKPDAAYTLIEKLYPRCERMDVFSREKRDGWHQFGDETDYFQR